MITYIKGGDIFNSRCALLVCPTNVYGVFGAGLAKQFKERFPSRCNAYTQLADRMMRYTDKTLEPGSVGMHGGLLFCATKQHWKAPSQLEWIKKGIHELQIASLVREASLAIPALGCGLGGLPWSEVRPLIDKAFKDWPYDVEVYEP